MPPQTPARVASQTAPQQTSRARLRDHLIMAFGAVRAETERRAAPLSAEDQLVQSMPDASPAKWHRAHTTWFFEQFILGEHQRGYKPFHPDFAFLYNSYYVSAGPRHARPQRGFLTRPSADEVTAYRAYVDATMQTLLENADDAKWRVLAPLLEIGLNHEQQHQELMFTDILHAFAQNPIAPIYDRSWTEPKNAASSNAMLELPEGIHTVGHAGDAFHFDNEEPAHRALVGPVAIALDLVTNAEWLEFMADGGYRTPTLWLSDGWALVQAEGWDAPGYWQDRDGEWTMMTLSGRRKVDPQLPVRHISYYEADAFARWSGQHLPTEMEWEVAARSGQINDAFGIAWQWTRSAYLPYPGYSAVEGALGEYNGKFMINQMVLRGSSLATPDGHSRLTYRNFFPPHARWQFSGLRLACYSR